MVKVRLLNGKPLMVGGKVAMSDDCCCAHPGACCICDSAITTEADCISAGGHWQINGCPTCVRCVGTITSQEQCTNTGGIWHVGATCASDPCAPCPTGNLTLTFDDSDFALRSDCFSGFTHTYQVQLASPIGGIYTVPADVFPSCFGPACVWDMQVFSIIRNSLNCTGTFGDSFILNIIIGHVSEKWYVWMFAGIDTEIVGGVQVGYYGFVFYSEANDLSAPLENMVNLAPISIDNDFFKWASYCGDDHTTFGVGIGSGGRVTIT